MMESYSSLVFKGQNILLKALAPYVCHELEKHYGHNWWEIGVLKKLSDFQISLLPKRGKRAELVEKLDLGNCLALVEYNWREVFQRQMSSDCRTWAKELIGVRNKLAHIGANDISKTYAYRALETMHLLCEPINPEYAKEIYDVLLVLGPPLPYLSSTTTETHNLEVKEYLGIPALLNDNNIIQEVNKDILDLRLTIDNELSDIFDKILDKSIEGYVDNEEINQFYSDNFKKIQDKSKEGHVEHKELIQMYMDVSCELIGKDVWLFDISELVRDIEYHIKKSNDALITISEKIDKLTNDEKKQIKMDELTRVKRDIQNYKGFIDGIDTSIDDPQLECRLKIIKELYQEIIELHTLPIREWVGKFDELCNKVLELNKDLDNVFDDLTTYFELSLGYFSSIGGKRQDEIQCITDDLNWYAEFVRRFKDNIIDDFGWSVSNTTQIPTHNNSEKEEETFTLPGAKYLEEFFIKNVIDIVMHPEKYKPFGIYFPSPIILYGKPGTGKTYAVKQLYKFLKWSVYTIDSQSVASPYIHQTSQKIYDIFQNAFTNAPSIIIIDEMDAYLSNRDGSHDYKVEEVAEFLRLIPEAPEKRVLVIGMTNQYDNLDPAIIREGRFDHHIEVLLPNADDIRAMLDSALKKIPAEEDINFDAIIPFLVDKPRSHTSFVIKEASILAGQRGKPKISQEEFDEVINRKKQQTIEKTVNKIGF